MSSSTLEKSDSWPGGTRTPASDVDHEKRPGLAAALEKDVPATGLRYLVIGTGGVGLSIVDALLARGEKHVRNRPAVAERAQTITLLEPDTAGDLGGYHHLRSHHANTREDKFTEDTKLAVRHCHRPLRLI